MTAAAAIAAQVTASAVVASDETSVRVAGKTWWEWVFVTAVCVLHVIRPSRGAAVVRTLFGAQRPRVWVSDSFGSQRGHADQWQMCLAHLLRDAQYAIDCGDDGFSMALKRLLLRALRHQRAAAEDCLEARVGQLHHVLGAAQGGNQGGGFGDELLQAPALVLGFGLGQASSWVRACTRASSSWLSWPSCPASRSTSRRASTCSVMS